MMNVDEFDDEERSFDPNDWDIRREGRDWTDEEFDKRIYQAPKKIEFAGGIFNNDRERLTVLAMLLENLGIDRVIRLGNLADWRAAVESLEQSGNNEYER